MSNRARFIPLLILGLLCLPGVPAFAQEPSPAPANSLLVTKTCAVAYILGNDASRNLYVPDGFITLAGTCDGSFGESQLLTPGEFRLFMHLIGPEEEYDVTCLGHLKWHGGMFAGVERYEFDKACVIPNGKHGYWWKQPDPDDSNKGPGAKPALPELGYIPANWDGDKLSVNFPRDYHDDKGLTIVFTVLHKMSGRSRMMAPGEEIQGPYVCPNGEETIAGKKMCRPETPKQDPRDDPKRDAVK